MEIKSYVPEREFFKGKTEGGMRICHEEFSVVDPANDFLIVAYRGLDHRVGKRLTEEYGIPSSEIAFLQRALVKHRRALLKGKKRPILIYADFLESTGLLLAVAQERDTASVARILLHTGRTDFAISPSLARSTVATLQAEDEITYDQLQDIFFYLDRLTSDSPNFGVWTRALLAAKFAGCRLSETDLPTADLPISANDRARLTVFLLCTFLTLRLRDGKVRTNTDSDDPPRPFYRVRVEVVREPPKKKAPADLFPFLETPAFRSFSLTAEATRVVLEGAFNAVTAEITQKGIRSVQPSRFAIRVVLETFFENM